MRGSIRATSPYARWRRVSRVVVRLGSGRRSARVVRPLRGARGVGAGGVAVALPRPEALVDAAASAYTSALGISFVVAAIAAGAGAVIAARFLPSRPDAAAEHEPEHGEDLDDIDLAA